MAYRIDPHSLGHRGHLPVIGGIGRIGRISSYADPHYAVEWALPGGVKQVPAAAQIRLEDGMEILRL